MKRIFMFFIFSLVIHLTGYGQGAQAYFNTSANLYVHGKNQQAIQSVTEGLKKYPSDPKLKALLDKLNEDKKEQQKKDQEKKEQEKKDQEKKEQEKKDQQKKEQEKKDQQNKDQQQKDQEKKEQEKKDQEQKDQQGKEQEKKDQPKKDEQPQDQEQKDDQKKDKKDVPPEVSEKLQQMKISEEKAKMILEAMKNQEAQYLQQNKRKATKPKDKGKPDW
jgi:hypothetical protein